MNNLHSKKLLLTGLFTFITVLAFSQPIYQKLRVDRYETIMRAGRTGSTDLDNTGTSTVIYLYGVPKEGTVVTTAILTFLNKTDLVPPPRYDAASKYIYVYYNKTDYLSVKNMLTEALVDKKFYLYAEATGSDGKVFNADLTIKKR